VFDCFGGMLLLGEIKKEFYGRPCFDGRHGEMTAGLSSGGIASMSRRGLQLWFDIVAWDIA